MKSPPPSTYESRMKNFKLNPSVKKYGRDDANEGNRTPNSSFPKVETRALGHQLQVLCDDQWRGTPLGTLGTFKIPHKYSRTTG